MNAQTKDIVTLETLSRAAKTRAVKAIDEIHRAYFVKGGIRDTTDKLRTQVESASSHIYALAVFATKQTANLEQAIVLFSAMCVFAEDHYKKEHEVENLKDALPTWAVFKSNILGSVRMGLSPLDYATEYELRQARMGKIREAAGTLGTSGTSAATPPTASTTVTPLQRAREAPGPVGIDEIGQWLGATGIHDSLRVLLAQVILNVEYIKRTGVGDAEAILRDASDKLFGLADKRKLKAATAE